jgi:hypothetical protein
MRFIPSVSLTVVMKGLGLVLTTFSAILSARYLGPSGKGILAY